MNEQPKEIEIKYQGWHKVTLDGDLITGNTFPLKDWIKKYLNGKWDGQRKGWVVDLEKVAKYSSADGMRLVVK